MKIVIGLGNIGEKYDGTRHNIGFYMVDKFALKHSAAWQHKAKLKSDIAELQVADEKVILVKPTTLYNASGEAALAIKQFYKVDNGDIVTVHDELALTFGIIRTRPTGSDAGNNGIKSLNEHIGPDYWRVRIGASGEHRIDGNDTNYVLGKLNENERSLLPDITKHVSELLMEFISSNSLTNHTVRLIP